MSQASSEKFLYFTVGLLKGSAALEALRQDATKYHMIDHPGQLIALRLTEYYETINQGQAEPAAQAPTVKVSPATETTAGHEQAVELSQRPASISFPPPSAPFTNVQPQPASMGQSHSRLAGYPDAASIDTTEPTNTHNQLTGKMRALRRENDNIVAVSSAAEQNADDAADYWSTL